ncbi:MAG: GAF domain-containing protein [Candidatus Rokubacteria bacterium]|nr:GAF domain-containing protein [Candidatus Rokubacteria bacterium]
MPDLRLAVKLGAPDTFVLNFTVLGGIARAATELTEAPLIAFWIADPTARTLTVGAFSDRSLGADYPVKSLRFGQDLVGWIAAHGRPVNVADLHDDERFLARAWARGHGLRSFLGVPITFQDSVLGVLTMLGRAPFRLDAEDQGLLESFAAQAALAIRNARIYEELRVAHENLERSQEQLIHSEKLSALGQLVAGVAHELNNPLSVVLGHAYLAETKTGAGGLEAHIRGMREGAERAAQIVRNLLQFARKTSSSRDVIDVNALVEQVIEFTRNAGATQNVGVVRELAPDLLPTSGDPGQLQQVLLNLVTNAYQAMPRGGTLTVRTRAAGRRLRVEVSDTGPGVRDDIRHKIFDPFFTTKSMGEGTGLGLSVAHGIVSAHGGRLWLDERAPRGATFVIELPVASPPAAVTEGDEPVLRPGCRILVVDDEPPVARVLGSLLEEIGARVVIVHSATEARAALARESFDAITLDLVMPGENGVEFWQRLERDRPDAARRVIFVTGNVDPSMRAFVGTTGCPVLAKPYTLRSLRETLASRLSRS